MNDDTQPLAEDVGRLTANSVRRIIGSSVSSYATARGGVTF